MPTKQPEKCPLCGTGLREYIANGTWDDPCECGLPHDYWAAVRTRIEEEKSDFAQELFGHSGLDDALEWIKANLTPNEVFDAADLDRWAVEHGYEGKADVVRSD